MEQIKVYLYDKNEYVMIMNDFKFRLILPLSILLMWNNQLFNIWIKDYTERTVLLK